MNKRQLLHVATAVSTVVQTSAIFALSSLGLTLWLAVPCAFTLGLVVTHSVVLYLARRSAL